MNVRAKKSFPPSEQKDNQHIIEHKQTNLESDRANTIHRYAKDRVTMRTQEARQLVEAERALEPNLDALVDKFSQEVRGLEQQVGQLTEANTQLEQQLELAREKLSHATALREDTQSSETPTVISFPELPTTKIVTQPQSTTPSMGFLGRLNRWLRSEDRPQRDKLSQSSYDQTQTPQAKADRARARSESMNQIADAALRTNMEGLQRNQEALAQEQQAAQKASFLTRWRHASRMLELQKNIRFQEAAIRARQAQLDKQTSAQAAK